MTEKTCKNCKHWEQTEDDWGDCPVIEKFVGFASNALDIQYDPPGATVKEFGCNQWETNRFTEADLDPGGGR